MFNPTTVILLALAAVVFLLVYKSRRSTRIPEAKSPTSFRLESAMFDDLEAPGVLSAEVESGVESSPLHRIIQLKIKLVDMRDPDPPPVYLAKASLSIQRYCKDSPWNTEQHSYTYRFYRSGEAQRVSESLEQQLKNTLAVYALHIAVEWNSEFPIREENRG